MSAATKPRRLTKKATAPTSARFNILFWNICGEVGPALLARTVSQLDVSLICLAESQLAPTQLNQQLNNAGTFRFTIPPSMTPRLCILAREDLTARECYSDINGRLAVFRLGVAKQKLLFAAVHLQSMNSTDEKDRYTEACIVADQIRDVEDNEANSRTILCGDLNMNPFSDGVVSAKAFHAVADRRIVEKGSRLVQNRRYPFFYNPMWNLLGDDTEGPPGTYYYRNSGHISYEWNMFDQVLIRPKCLSLFRRVQVLTEACGKPLALKSGRPNKRQHSDHFPLLIQCEIENA